MVEPSEQAVSHPRVEQNDLAGGDSPTRGSLVEADTAERLRLVTQTVREMSVQTEPAQMVEAFSRRMDQLLRRDRVVSLSRRDVDAPNVHITRSSDWSEPINPWKEKGKLPLVSGGVFSDLIYGDQLRVIDDLEPPAGDPAYDYLEGMRSLVAIPLYDRGVALNMVVMFSRQRAAFDHRMLPDLMLQANLFGKATQSLVLASQLREAYAELDWEMRRIGQLQRALLPPVLPAIPGVSIAVSYETAARAGGDYYDFFDLLDGRWGILVGDVSGHGASAAVVMAMTRTLLHARCQRTAAPDEVLAVANEHLLQHSERYDGTFVTAFYGIFDPRNGSLEYASAGHNPPILMRSDGRVSELDGAQSLPLGVLPQWSKVRASTTLRSADTLLLYTDGITEASDESGQMYGRRRLYGCMSDPTFSAQGVIDCILGKLNGFTKGRPLHDDRTLLAIRLKP